MIFRIIYKSGRICLPFCHNLRVWQTDWLIDTFLVASSRWHSMQRGKNLWISVHYPFAVFTVQTFQSVTHFLYQSFFRHSSLSSSSCIIVDYSQFINYLLTCSYVVRSRCCFTGVCPCVSVCARVSVCLSVRAKTEKTTLYNLIGINMSYDEP